MTQRFVRIAVWSALGAAMTLCGYLLISTTFMPYDDEGYVLVSILNYLAGLRLYDDVFSQYGPWPFVYHELITTLSGLPLTHALGRMLTLLHWVLASLLCGAICWRLARAQWAAVVASLLVFSLSWQNTSEPSHPGSHIMLLVALAGAIITGLPGSGRSGLGWAALGAIAGLLLLTKINVGLLLVAGIGCHVLRTTPWSDRWRPLAQALAVGGMLALPWVLMGKQLHLGWVLVFALLFTLTALGIGWTAPCTPAKNGLRGYPWLLVPAAALPTLGVILVRVGLHGTQTSSLLDAILLKPLHMPANFMVGLHWYPETWLIAAVSAAIVGKAGFEIRRRGQLAPSTRLLLTAARLGGLILLTVLARYWSTHAGIFHFSAYCLPLLPLYLVPLSTDPDGARRFAREGVICVALPQVLHAFPVAGSQLAWATFLCVPLMVAGVADTRQVLTDLSAVWGRRLAAATAAIALATAAFLLGLLGYTGWHRYTHSRPLDLPAAGDIRLDGKTRQAFRLLHLNSVIHADLLFSRQGMFSHNIWSGIPTPTAQNATHWFWLLTETSQQEIIARLASTPRTALITSQTLDEFMVKENVPFGGPLQDFVRKHYRPLFRYADFTFHVPTDSQAVAFGRYELLESAENPGNLLLRTHVRLDGQPAHIRMEGLNHPWDNGPDLLTPQSSGVAEPINPQGQATGPAVPLPSGRPLQGLYRVSVICPRLPASLPWQDYLVVIRDPENRFLSDSTY